MKSCSDLPEWSVRATFTDGETYSGRDATDLLLRLKSEDFTLPSSLLDYKTNTARRAEVFGVHLLFWDATSFLLAMQSAGFCEVEFNSL